MRLRPRSSRVSSAQVGTWPRLVRASRASGPQQCRSTEPCAAHGASTAASREPSADPSTTSRTSARLQEMLELEKASAKGLPRPGQGSTVPKQEETATPGQPSQAAGQPSQVTEVAVAALERVTQELATSKAMMKPEAQSDDAAGSPAPQTPPFLGAEAATEAERTPKREAGPLPVRGTAEVKEPDSPTVGIDPDAIEDMDDAQLQAALLEQGAANLEQGAAAVPEGAQPWRKD